MTGGNFLSMFTEMCTGLEGAGLTLVVEGPCCFIFATGRWREEQAPLTPTRDLEGATATLLRLGAEGLTLLSRTNMVKYPMAHTSGLFEVRKKGVRFYGARLATSPTEICVLIGAEHKPKGENEADKRLLARCTGEAEGLLKILQAVAEKGSEKKR